MRGNSPEDIASTKGVSKRMITPVRNVEENIKFDIMDILEDLNISDETIPFQLFIDIVNAEIIGQVGYGNCKEFSLVNCWNLLRNTNNKYIHQCFLYGLAPSLTHTFLLCEDKSLKDINDSNANQIRIFIDGKYTPLCMHLKTATHKDGSGNDIPYNYSDIVIQNIVGPWNEKASWLQYSCTIQDYYDHAFTIISDTSSPFSENAFVYDGWRKQYCSLDEYENKYNITDQNIALLKSYMSNNDTTMEEYINWQDTAGKLYLRLLDLINKKVESLRRKIKFPDAI